MHGEPDRTGVRGLVAAALCLVAMAALPTTAGAVLSGENGRILFVQGPTGGNAQLFLLPVPSSIGGGTLSPPITTAAVQHRHPTWSPDRTKIAYAAGSPSCNPNNCDIFVLDLTTPGAVPQNITNTPLVNEDRPAWSPDGTRIAFESEVTDGSAQLDVLVDADPFGTGVNLNLTASAEIEGKPAWSPNSQTLFYALGNLNVAPNGANNDMRIKREPADNNGSPIDAFSHASGAHEFQPSISPDGTRICFTLSPVAGFSTQASVLVAPLGGSATVLESSGAGDYNCTWSPDGAFVAYTSGVTTAGRLVMERADGTSPIPVELAQDPGADDFDGNADWAPDARPLCPDSTVMTGVNVPVTFQPVCTDTGPAYEQSEVFEFPDTEPANGVLADFTAGEPLTYTPNPGFVGNDSFQVQSFDELGFGTDLGTVTIRVAAPCAGQTPTILGTAGADQLGGTAGADVIDGLGGNDTVNALGGNDVVCGGPGKDTLKGGGGKDRLLGQAGKDKLKGGGGKDTCKGGKGKDTAAACEVKKSI